MSNDSGRRWVRTILGSLGAGMTAFVTSLQLAVTATQELTKVTGTPQALTQEMWIIAIGLGLAMMCTTGAGFLSQSPKEPS